MNHVMVAQEFAMTLVNHAVIRKLAIVLIAFSLGLDCQAKGRSGGGGGGRSYSSGGSHSSSFGGGGHSYSSGGSHSFSSGGGHTFSSGGSSKSSSGGSFGSSRSSAPTGSGGSKSFTSSGGKSYSSTFSGNSSGNAGSQRGYYSSKSYSSGASRMFTSTGGGGGGSGGSQPGVSSTKSVASSSPSASSPSSAALSFDNSAARAKKEQVSQQNFSQYKSSQSPPVSTPRTTVSSSPSYAGSPPPIINSGGGYSRARVYTTYVPDSITISTRPTRIYNYYGGYYSRPWVVYNDPYNSYFWWWLLDRSLDDRAYWAYHHRYDMDPARYQALVANDAQLDARVSQLEAQQVARDPSYTPTGLDRDLMYSDQYVARNYSTRSTPAGAVAFWVVAVPSAIAATGFFIWLIWFKRW